MGAHRRFFKAAMVATPLITTRYITRVSKALEETELSITEGEPIITETVVPVRDIVALWQDEVRPEEIPGLLYGQVSAAQVFDAISFYLNNQSEMDGYLKRYRELGALSRDAIVLSHSPLWDELEGEIERDRRELERRVGRLQVFSLRILINRLKGLQSSLHKQLC